MKKKERERNCGNHDKRELHWEPEGGLGFRAVETFNTALWLSFLIYIMQNEQEMGGAPVPERGRR